MKLEKSKSKIIRGSGMKRGKYIWKVLLFLGSVPFLTAFGFCFVSSLSDGVGAFLKLSFWDYLFLYSLMYWWTYVIGMVLIVLSVVKLKKKHEQSLNG